MCTGFVKRGNDVIAGFNLDLAEGVWDYRVYPKKDMFYIGIKVGSTVYKTHGINKNGSFANLPYMNAPEIGVYSRAAGTQRIDLLVDGCISGKYGYSDVLKIAREKKLVNVKNASMHSLISDYSGNMMILEPGLGYREITGDHAVISNFPLLCDTPDLSPVWYGKQRYDKAEAILVNSNASFGAKDALELLYETRQGEPWATRVSFVWSRNENTVYYALDSDFNNIKKHIFG